MEIFDPQAHTSGRSASYRCLLRYRGASTYPYLKKSFAVKLIDETGGDLDADLFGIRKENSWILNSMVVDRIRMRDRICFDLWNAISQTPYPTAYGNRNGTEGRFVELFLNGEYNGLYCFTDKIDRKLLALKKAKAQADGTAHLRGLLYKGGTWCDAIMLRGYDESARTDTACWNGWELKYPEDYPSAATWQPLADLIDFCNSSAFASSYTDYFYLDNMVDYATLILAFHIRDIGFKNSYLSTPDIRNGHKFLITPWDMDTSLGGEWDGQHYDELAGMSAITKPLPFALLYNYDMDNFRERLRTRWGELSSTVLPPSAINRRLDDYAQAFRISGAWQREYERWNDNPVPLAEHIDEELDYVKDWYKRNYVNVCHLMDVETTSVEAPFVSAEKTPVEVYTVEGCRVPTLRKGVNIVRYPDGSSRKVLVR